MILLVLTLSSLLGWLYLAFFHGQFWIPLCDERADEPEHWPSVHIVIPARNEADVLPKTLSSILNQQYSGVLTCSLIDDHSGDDTNAIARKIALESSRSEQCMIESAPPLQEGWTGKVAAMNVGLKNCKADYILFTDADIIHHPDHLKNLVSHAETEHCDLVSRMVLLSSKRPFERLLIPAFVFFFMMLYPFRWVASANHRTAGAAGGVMLVRANSLKAAGGLTTISHAIIDDCSLANLIKIQTKEHPNTRKIDLRLTKDAKSVRSYQSTHEIWSMIARTAFTQLRYSPILLGASVVGLLILFLIPPLAALTANQLPIREIGFCACVIMALIYLPLLDFYCLSPLWVFSLPCAALFYIGATLDSARLYWQGKGGMWKGRSQA